MTGDGSTWLPGHIGYRLPSGTVVLLLNGATLVRWRASAQRQAAEAARRRVEQEQERGITSQPEEG